MWSWIEQRVWSWWTSGCGPGLNRGCGPGGLVDVVLQGSHQKKLCRAALNLSLSFAVCINIVACRYNIIINSMAYIILSIFVIVKLHNRR